MAAIIVNTGLQRIGVNASQATAGSGVTYDANRYIQTMSVDDSSTAFTATDTALDSGGAVTNMYDLALDSTPSRSSQTISHVATVPTGQGNFTIRRIALHDDTAGNVTTSSVTLTAGVDGQSFTKTSDFAMAFTLDIQYTDGS